MAVPYYLGIDLNDEYAMISYFQLNNKEPETVSTVAGSELFQIPLMLAKRKGIGQWYYGDEVQKKAKNCELICVDHLLRRAVAGESIRIESESYLAEELLFLYLQKLIQLPQKLGNPAEFDRLVITVERLSKAHMELFWRIAKELEIEQERFMVIDHKESFYYFTMNQSNDIFLHDVYLFDCEDCDVQYYGLSRNPRTKPQVVSIIESEHYKLTGNRDAGFSKIVQEAFANKIVSAAFLVGGGFDGAWMKDSLQQLCRGRRAFMGKNLFSKGACYAAAVRGREEDWEYIYMGENEMKFNLSLKVRSRGEAQFYNLISAGKNWFESSGQCEIILNDAKEINFWKQLPNSREAKIETLELTDIPNRPARCTRVRVKAVPIADDEIEITIEDLGFGEFFRSTGKSWKYTMSM